MDRVVAFADHPIDMRYWVVVGIGQPRIGQRHIGIMHRSGDATFRFLHLAWHCRLRNDDNRPDYLSVWVAPKAPPERQRMVAALCRRVWRKNERGGIPYAFSRPQGSFDPATGAFLIGPSRFGLTCASFVLAVFHAAGLQLADYETWPSDRAGDREWQACIVAALEGQAEPEHIEHVRSEIGSVRFRPEEVAACVALAPPAASFQDAEKLGGNILDCLQRYA